MLVLYWKFHQYVIVTILSAFDDCVNHNMIKPHLKHLKRIALVIGLLLLVWLIFRGFQYLGGGAGKEAEDSVFHTPVEVVTVRLGDIPVQVRAFGSLVAVDAGEVSAEIAGQIDNILFEEGQFVEQGALLIHLDSAIYEANLKSAEAEAALSLVNYERTSQLVERGAQSQENLDIAAAELASREADVAIRQAELNKTSLVAPFEGHLGARRISLGNYVAPGDPLVSIVNQKILKIDYSVPEYYLRRLAVGQTVELTTSAFPNQVFTGTVDFIAPMVSEATRSITIRALVSNEEEVLSPGLSVQVTHALGRVDQALLLPEEALVATLEGQIVYRVVNDRAVSTRVMVGSRVDGVAQITDGLERGDRVVIGGQQKIRDGSMVEIIPSAPMAMLPDQE